MLINGGRECLRWGLVSGGNFPLSNINTVEPLLGSHLLNGHLSKFQYQYNTNKTPIKRPTPIKQPLAISLRVAA